MRAALALACVAVLTAAGCTRAGDGARMSIAGEPLSVAVADDLAEQRQGLQDRPGLEDGEGMLFVWDDAAVRLFGIMGVPYALDVIWVGSDRRVIGVSRLAPDGPEIAESPGPARWVVEVPARWAEEHGARTGAAVELPGE